MKKYPAIHGGATYVLPVMLSSGGAAIEGEVVATYRVGSETTSRNFDDVVDVGAVSDPRAPATDQVRRYDCVIDAGTTAALGPDAMITLDIDVTINSRVYHVVGAVVQYYAYGGEVENTPQGAHVVLNVAPYITIVSVLAGGESATAFSFIVSDGEPLSDLGAEIGWYCFDYTNGNLYGPRPDWAGNQIQEWPLIGQFGAGLAAIADLQTSINVFGDDLLALTGQVEGLATVATSGDYADLSNRPSFGDAAYQNIGTTSGTVASGAHTHTLGNINQSGATTGQVPTWSGSAWAPATPSAGGGMAIGGAITSAVNNRILQSDGSGNLAQQGTWYFDALGFGAIMPTQQALRTTDGGGGFIGNIGGGILMGRTDVYPDVFIGFYSNGGITVHPNSGYNFGNNPNDLRLNDARLTRRAADLIEGACLAMRAYTVGTLPDAATWINAQVVCTNETGGRVPVFSDGTNWRRVTDRAIAS